MTLKTTSKHVLTLARTIVFPPQIQKPYVVNSSNDHLRILYVLCNKDTRKQVEVYLTSSADRNRISETSTQFERLELVKVVAVLLFLWLLGRYRKQIKLLFKSAVSKIGSGTSKQVRLDLQGVDDVDVKKELKKIGFTATNSQNDVVPLIVVRYHGFRVDSDIADSLQNCNWEEIERTILIILHRHEERAQDLHGKVEDPMMIPFSETETPSYRDYQMLKGIIHIDVGPEKKDIFRNCGQTIKDWVNEIEPKLNPNRNIRAA